MSSRLEILGLEAARQHGLVWPDVYFTPAYGHACEASDAATWEVAVWNGGELVEPWLRRALPEGLGIEGFDVVGPYGYAGVGGEASPEAWAAFRAELRRVQAERGAVAEFLRMGAGRACAAPLAAADARAQLVYHHDTVMVDLSGGHEAVFARYDGRARTKVRKPEKLGYVGTCGPAEAAHLAPGAPFRALYDATMVGLEARAYYRFNDAYFARLAEGLASQLVYAEVQSPEGRVVSAAIGFGEGEVFHLHLTGTDYEARKDSVGNLLYDTVLRWAGENGFARVHLGGGLAPDDALFFFKVGFGGDRVPFHTSRTVLHADRYAALVATRAAQLGQAPEALAEGGFFPAYRAGA